jgi:hypothetical protein
MAIKQGPQVSNPMWFFLRRATAAPAVWGHTAEQNPMALTQHSPESKVSPEAPCLLQPSQMKIQSHQMLGAHQT